MRRFLWFLLVCSSCTDYGQLTLVSSLPDGLCEISGMDMMSGDSLIWMHQDSGNGSVLYGFNLQGNLVKTSTVNASNRDWEDLTFAPDGTLYVGDIGTNKNNRKDLVILQIPSVALRNQDEVEPEKIYVTYPKSATQKKGKNFVYDAESLFYHQGFLFLCTKSRSNKAPGETVLFRFPATPGRHVATEMGRFTTCNATSCRVTAADLSPDGTKLALLTHTTLWLFTAVQGDDFFKGPVQQISLGVATQKEGVCFKDNQLVYIADECPKHGYAYLYSLRLP